MELLPALVGDAHEWLARELEDDASLTTVELMCTKIISHLSPAEKRRAYLHEFHEVKMTEDDEPRGVASKLRTLTAAAMPDLSQEAKEQMVSEQLPRLVPSKWRLRVLDSEATTVEALVRRIERIKTTEQLKSNLGSDRSVERPVRLVKCFVCCKVEHKAAQCPSKSQCDSRKHSGAGRPEIVCFQCGGKGHMKYQCPSPSGKSSRETQSGQMGNPGSISGETLSRDNIASQVRRVDTAEKSAPTEICAVIKLNGIKNVEAVVDTGSSCSILSAEVASELQVPVDDSDEQSYIAANSIVASSLGSSKVTMMIGGETVVHVFTISDDITDSVILGMDVLHVMKAVVDCASGSLQI